FTMIALHALVFRSRLYNNAEELDQARQLPGRARLAAALSLVLWVSVVCAGRGIGYIAAPFGFHYASAATSGASISRLRDGAGLPDRAYLRDRDEPRASTGTGALLEA